MQLENTTPFEAELTGGFESSGHECVIVAVKGTFVRRISVSTTMSPGAFIEYGG